MFGRLKIRLFMRTRHLYRYAGKSLNLTNALLLVGVIVVGIVATFFMVKVRKAPEKTEKASLAPLVKVFQVEVNDIQMVIKSYGTVSPKVQIEIVPQVGGKIVSIDPQFKAGGFIKADEPIMQIDPRDYELAVQQAEAIVADAKVKLDLEQAEADIAINEWEQLYPEDEPPSPLVFHEPQIRQSEARLKSAEAQLAVAKLNLERTKLSLPIDAIVIDEKVDLGQFVIVGQSVGSAYGIDSVEIELPLEDEELKWFDIPDSIALVNGAAESLEGALAKVTADSGGKVYSWSGRVRRTTGMVDVTSRMVSVVVEVDKPFEVSRFRPPLLPGTFVEVSIEGKVLKDVIAVPRNSVRNRNEVWVVRDSRLHIQQLEIARMDDRFVYVVSGLEDGEMIIVSSLDIVIENMKVRTQYDQIQETIADSNQSESGGSD